MRKFKIFFYPIYIIITLLVLYFSIDFLYRMVSDIDAFYTFLMKQFGLTNLPLYGTVTFLILSLLMTTGIIVENTHILSLKKKLNKAEQDVLNLKAKLYDKSQTVENPETSTDKEEDQE